MFKTALFLSLIGWFVFPGRAGTVNGITLENFTGLPLARSRLTLERLDGGRMNPVGTAVASGNGQFSFGPLEEGYYQLRANRAGFAEGRVGQRRNGGPGLPIFVPREGVQFVELRLKRLAIITGRTLDENRVGLPGVPVYAYQAGVPARIAASAISDDLGVYRITGLAAGKYLIRTGPAQPDEALTLLPTYYPFTSVLLGDARAVVAELDGETGDVNIQPVAGSLRSLAIAVTGCLGSAQVTLSSDTGRKQVTAVCNHDPVVFNALGPGEYEVVAEGEADRQKLAAFTFLQLDSNRQIGLPLRPLVELRVRLIDGVGPAIRDAGVIVRRRDLAGEGPAIAVTSERLPLQPGYWQITARTPVGYYLSDVKVDAIGYRRARKDPDPDWFEFSLESSLQASISISTQAAQLSGHVSLGGKEAIAAPVYLLPTTSQTRRRMNGPRITQTDRNGNYRFEGLAPGTYLVTSSFDLADVSEESMAGRAQTITIEEGRSNTQDLELSQQR